MGEVVLTAARELLNFSGVCCYLGSGLSAFIARLSMGQNPSLDHAAADGRYQPRSRGVGQERLRWGCETWFWE